LSFLSAPSFEEIAMMRRKSASSVEESKKNASAPKRHTSPSLHPRSKSADKGMLSSPELWQTIKGVMKITTLDESLHSTYGSESGNERERIRFKNIEIREYARTVGDNPSVSSGTCYEYSSLKAHDLQVIIG
jgi:hypothetical protein